MRRKAPKVEPEKWTARLSRLVTDPVYAIGLVVLAFMHRLFFLRSNLDCDWPFTIFYEGDTRIYYEYAMALLRGHQTDSGIPFHPPGFPYFLTMVYAVLGADTETGSVQHFSVKLVMAGLGSLFVGLQYLFVRPYLGRTLAILAALLCTYHFGLYVLSVAAVSEGLYLVLLMLALLLWSRKLNHYFSVAGTTTEGLTVPQPTQAGQAKAGLGLGLLLGSMSLTRAESTLIAVVMVGFGLLTALKHYRRIGLLRRILPWLLVSMGWVLAVMPWTLYNYHRLSQMNQELGDRLSEPLPTFVPLTLYGPINLAMANHEQADGGFSREIIHDPTGSGRLDVTYPHHLEYLLHGHHKAWDFVCADPKAFGLLVLRKWGIYLNAGRIGFTQWNLPGGFVGERGAVDVFVPYSLWGLTLYLFVVAGFVGLWRKGGTAQRLAILIGIFTAAGLFTTAFFFGYARQALLLIPFWLVLAAVGMAALTSQLAQHMPTWISSHLRQIGMLIVLVLLLVEASGANAKRNYLATGQSFTTPGKINSDETIKLQPVKD